MSNIKGWYYLHENGELIYKPDPEAAADIRESDFALAMWPFDPTKRLGAWNILVEALAAGANRSRVLELAEKWGCDDSDAPEYAKRVGCVLSNAGDAWTAVTLDFDLTQKPEAGIGGTALDAMASLCKDLGYEPSKMWGQSFAELLKPAEQDAPIELKPDMRIVIRACGTIEQLACKHSIDQARSLINAEALDSVNLRQHGLVMLVDDEGRYKNLPSNKQATMLYHQVCLPGTTMAICGDVVIVPDDDFA